MRQRGLRHPLWFFFSTITRAGWPFISHMPTIFGEVEQSCVAQRITAAENSATVLLPQEIIEMIGVQQVDEVDVSVVDRTVMVKPLEEAEHAQKLESVRESVFQRRASAYEELAKRAE